MDKILNKQETARKNFETGYNCAQSVLLAFSKEIGLSREMVLKLASSFGGGMGRMREVCGAVSAMFMVAGILKGYILPNDDIQKQEHYRLIQDLAQEFKSKFSTIICRELLGDALSDTDTKPTLRNQLYYNSRPCSEIISFVTQIIEDKLITF